MEPSPSPRAPAGPPPWATTPASALNEGGRTMTRVVDANINRWCCYHHRHLRQRRVDPVAATAQPSAVDGVLVIDKYDGEIFAGEAADHCSVSEFHIRPDSWSPCPRVLVLGSRCRPRSDVFVDSALTSSCSGVTPLREHVANNSAMATPRQGGRQNRNRARRQCAMLSSASGRAKDRKRQVLASTVLVRYNSPGSGRVSAHLMHDSAFGLGPRTGHYSNNDAVPTEQKYWAIFVAHEKRRGYTKTLTRSRRRS